MNVRGETRRVERWRICARILVGVLMASSVALLGEGPARPQLEASTALGPQVEARAGLAVQPRSDARPRSSAALGSLTPEQRAAAVDAYWGDGAPTDEKLRIFDEFWQYADEHFAAFQGIDVDWPAVRDRYRPEVAHGVSRGRFAAIMNQLSLALHDSHSLALDLSVNVSTVPERGVPLFGVSGWVVDTSGACLTAQDDGSALVYSVIQNHPLGLERGDRILGYDGRPWRDLYRQLLREELPLWPIWWGSSRSAYDHTFVMSAGLNWHLFDTMDIAKHGRGNVMHLPTSLMPGPLFYGFCSEEMAIPGVPKPRYFVGDYVTAGIVDGTRIGYVYAWSWHGNARDDFAAAIHELTQVEHVDGLIIDLRFNEGGFMRAPMDGLAELFSNPTATIGMDGRRQGGGHLDMTSVVPPNSFVVDFAYGSGDKVRVTDSYSGPVAVLLGPGAVSAGDIAAILADFLPRVRTFGKSTSMAVGLPTQPALGTEIDLGEDWFARVAETNTYDVGAPNDYLTHAEFRVDESVWLEPNDVAVGEDTVVKAALRWLAREGGG